VAQLRLVRRMQPRYRFSFRSPEAQEISAHLTPLERDAFVGNARAYGRRLGWRISLLMIPCVVAGFYSLWLAAAVFVAFLRRLCVSSPFLASDELSYRVLVV